MRSQRLHSRTAHAALRPRSGVSIGDIAIRIAAPGARAPSTRAALLGSVCIGALAMLGPGTAHAVDGTWTGPGARVDHRHQLELLSPTVPDGTATFTNNGAPTSVTISNNASINTIEFDRRGARLFVHRSELGDLHRQQSPATASSFMPGFSVSSGATLAIGNGGVGRDRLAGGRRRLAARRVRSQHLLFIAGSTSTTFSGVISGPGSIELDDAATLTVDRHRQRDRRRSRSLPLLDGSLTIDGGSLTVNGLAQGVTVEGGTLTSSMAARCKSGRRAARLGDLLVAST